MLALRTLARSDLPVARLVAVEPGSILMTLMPGERLDRLDADAQLAGLRASAAREPVLCHGGWTSGNLLAVDGEITGIVDWEAAHLGDPIRELSRAAWGASLNDPGRFDAIVEGYGAEPAEARAWAPIHAAELWLWFREAGPPEYLTSLTRRLQDWPG